MEKGFCIQVCQQSNPFNPKFFKYNISPYEYYTLCYLLGIKNKNKKQRNISDWTINYGREQVWFFKRSWLN